MKKYRGPALSGKINIQVRTVMGPHHEPIPNFVGPPTLAPAINGTSVVMLTWAVSFLIMRLYANTQAPRRLRIEDCKFESIHSCFSKQLMTLDFCIIAMILAISDTGLILSCKVLHHSSDLVRS